MMMMTRTMNRRERDAQCLEVKREEVSLCLIYLDNKDCFIKCTCRLATSLESSSTSSSPAGGGVA